MTMDGQSATHDKALAKGTTNNRSNSQVAAKIPGDKLFFFHPATAEIMVCDAGAPAEAVRREAAFLESKLLTLSGARAGLAATIKAYDKAQASGQPKDDSAVNTALKKSEAARDALLDEFKELSEANKGEELMELLPLMDSKTGKPVFGGKKFTYVRSSKVKSHFRRYKLSNADKPEMKSFLTWQDGKGWQLDKKKLKESFDTVKTKVNVAEQVDGLWLPESWSPAFVDGFNEKMHFGQPEDKQSPDAMIAFSGEAHLLRFYGGASLTKSVDISAEGFKKALRGEGEVGAEYKLRGSLGLDLASGKVDGNLYLPWRRGFELWVPLFAEALSSRSIDGNHECTLGHFRFLIKGTLKGSCGASVLGEGGAEFKLGRDGSKQGLRGVASKRKAQDLVAPRLNVKEGSVHATAKAGAEITAFAGAEGEASIHGAFQWQKPESVEFADFASIEPGITAQAGAGGTACFYITYQEGKFRIKAKLGACVGVGLKGEVLAAIGAGEIVEFALWFKYQVTNAADQNLDYFRKDAFKVFCKMCALAIVEGKQLSAYLGKTLGQLDRDMEIWITTRREEFVQRLQQAHDQLVNSIAEVKGILLYELQSIQQKAQQIKRDASDKLEELQQGVQQAIQSLLNSIYLRNELYNVFQHASADGEKISPAQSAALMAWVEHHSGTSVTELASNLKTEPTPGYYLVANNSFAYRMNNGTQIAWRRDTLMAPDDTRFA
jgi:hypothetical protein